jgi:single-strand DNA-binding protein
MNNIVLVGKLVRDPQIKYIGSENIAVTTFTIAVDRRTKSQKDQKSDIIEIQTWDKQAENCAKYLSKGRLIAVNGQLRIEKYKNSNGENKYYTRVKADNVKFLSSTQSKNKYFDGSNVFEETGVSVETIEEKLPF